MQKLDPKAVQDYIDKDRKCPICQSEELDFGDFNAHGHLKLSQNVFCLDCNAQWQDEYVLYGISFDQKNGRTVFSHKDIAQGA